MLGMNLNDLVIAVFLSGKYFILFYYYFGCGWDNRVWT
jgi:hypothetical protein